MTPIRRPYLAVKRRFPVTIVLFRLGDFYNTFDEDAGLCARMPMAGPSPPPVTTGLRPFFGA